ncbi:MAG: sugar ABC transporter ATP-binding protein [Actinomycetota bacterium]|nr:MAG: sugar ABC transporter ATP-binding protein [Actinomycetota bacterium]
MSTPVLQIQGLTKTYGGQRAVDGVDLSVAAGEIVALVGKNGAGKSTIIRAVSGATTGDSGTISLVGQARRFSGPLAARQAGVSVMHQELNVAARMTVAENLGLGAGYPRRAGLFIDRRALDRKARSVLARVHLDQLDPDTPMTDLTPVQQRLVMIAAALWVDARLLILDEPTASLTEEEIGHLHRTVQSLRAEGVGVLYVSHRLDEVLALADRIVVMRDGLVVADVPRADLTKAQLVALIGGVARNVHRAAAPAPLSDDAPVMLDVQQLQVLGATAPVSMQVRRGEVLGVGGLVGAGRTELLRGIYGADPVLDGEVTVGGRPVRRGSPRASIAAGLVLLTEDRAGQGAFHGFSVRWNTTIGSLRRFRALSWLPVPSVAAERRSAGGLIDQLRIAGAQPDTDIDALSGGNQQKVLISRWLATGAQVILLDEPTIGIDVHAKAEIYDLLRSMAAQGRTVVVVSADLAELEMLCHRVIVLHDGAVGAELVGAQISEEAILRTCFRLDEADTEPAPVAGTGVTGDAAARY